MKLQYEVMPSAEYPGDWLCSAVDFKGDGDIYLTIFSGPLTAERAWEYARWMNDGSKQKHLHGQRMSVGASSHVAQYAKGQHGQKRLKAY